MVDVEERCSAVPSTATDGVLEDSVRFLFLPLRLDL